MWTCFWCVFSAVFIFVMPFSCWFMFVVIIRLIIVKLLTIIMVANDMRHCRKRHVITYNKTVVNSDMEINT